MEDTFFEIHMVHVRCKVVCLRCVVMCHDGKKLYFKWIKTPMVRGTKLNLVLVNQMNNEKNNDYGSI